MSHTVLKMEPFEEHAALLSEFSRAVDTLGPTDTGEFFVLYMPRYLQNGIQLSKSSVFIFTVSFAFTLLSQGGSRFSKETGSDEPLTSVLSGTGGG